MCAYSQKHFFTLCLMILAIFLAPSVVLGQENQLPPSGSWEQLLVEELVQQFQKTMDETPWQEWIDDWEELLQEHGEEIEDLLSNLENWEDLKKLQDFPWQEWVQDLEKNWQPSDQFFAKFQKMPKKFFRSLPIQKQWFWFQVYQQGQKYWEYLFHNPRNLKEFGKELEFLLEHLQSKEWQKESQEFFREIAHDPFWNKIKKLLEKHLPSLRWPKPKEQKK